MWMKHLKGPRARSDLCHIQIIKGYKNFLLTIIKLKSFECEDYPTGCNPKLVQQRNHKALPMNYTIEKTILLTKLCTCCRAKKRHMEIRSQKEVKIRHEITTVQNRVKYSVNL